MSAQMMVRAHAEGQTAAQEGLPATACPYKPDGETSVEQAQARMWLRGYEKIKPLPVDYS